VGERIYFAADDGVHGREPWSTDGTPDGTQLLADLAPGSASSVPRELTAWGDRVVFAADDGVHGMELWRTGAPGMPSGVPALLDIHPGILPSSPQGFTVSGERLFFFADDGVHGLEPWAWPVGDRLFEDGFESGDASAWEELEPAP
jgi:ELWxxDGT repeat protein